MPDAELESLLAHPAVVTAVRDLGVSSLAVEDVLRALRAFGTVRIDVLDDPSQPYVCRLNGGEEHGRGRSVLHAALACWAGVLEDFGRYTQQGVAELEQFLLGPDLA